MGPIGCEPNSCEYRPGDWVIVRHQDRNTVGQVTKIFADNKSHIIQVCHYFQPEDTQHLPSQTFWPHEVFKTREHTYHVCTEVISRCFVLHISQYLKGRPKSHLWQHGTPLYVCESRYSSDNPLAAFSQISKWKDITDPEMTFFERPATLEKVCSPFLRGITGPGRLLNDIEIAIMQRQFVHQSPDLHQRAPFTTRPPPPPIQSDAASSPPSDQSRRHKRQRTEPSISPDVVPQVQSPVQYEEETPRETAATFDADVGLAPVPEYEPMAHAQTDMLPNEVDQIPSTFTMNPTNHYVGQPGKPPFSYASLIAQAIWNKPERRCRLEEIYEFVSTAYPWYRTTSTSWQNMLRHNLSLRPCFVKVPRTGGVGKGNWWTMDLEKEPGGFDGMTFGSRRVVAAGNRQLAAEAASKQPRVSRKRDRLHSQQDFEEEADSSVENPSQQDLGAIKLHHAFPVPHHQPVVAHQIAPRPMPPPRPEPMPVQEISPTSSTSSHFASSSPPRHEQSVSPLLGSFSSQTSAETLAGPKARSKQPLGVFSQLGYVPFGTHTTRSSQNVSNAREAMTTSEADLHDAAGALDQLASVCSSLIPHHDKRAS